MMKSMIFFQIFECVAVIFETFIVYQYISGLFDKRNEQKSALPWYVLFCIGLILLSLFFRKEIALIGYTLVGVYVLALGIYKTSTSSRIFSIFYFSAIMVGSEIFTSGLISDIWNIDLANVLEYGALRVLCILVAKLIEIFLVKASVAVANWKTNNSSKGEVKMMLPLLLCQVFSILLAHYVAMICLDIYGNFEQVALFTMIGIIYMNIIVFWYFDRIKSAFEYKSKSETAELKLELQKQYHEVLNEHQKETDILWHDMKKHINLMKTLIESGQHEITSEYIHELEAQMSDTVKIIRTEYPVLSALLTEQAKRAKKESISFDLDVRLDSDMKIVPVDLCIILGNLFDNAFAACNALSPEAAKYIKASIVQRNSVISIRIENTYAPDTKPKRRSGKHGLGQKNIRQAVIKYHGRLDIAEENGVYTAAIIIP